MAGSADEQEADRLRRLAAGRIARLATVTDDGRPHVVPCCFAVVGGVVYSAVDGKPKTTTALKRLDNVASHPAASLIVDHYDDDDWRRLWWVRVDGSAGVVGDDAEVEHALDHLAGKYRQYRERRPRGAVLRIDIERCTGWIASGRW